MRENIGLFRGLDPGSERFQWVYGGLVHQTDFYGDPIDKYFIVDGTHTDDVIGEPVEVDPLSVGECTGLKDSNGRLIFENDIVMLKDLCGEQVMYVTFEDGEFVLRSKEFEHFRAALRLIYSENAVCQVVGFMHNGTEFYECP